MADPVRVLLLYMIFGLCYYYCLLLSYSYSFTRLVSICLCVYLSMFLPLLFVPKHDFLGGLERVVVMVVAAIECAASKVMILLV